MALEVCHPWSAGLLTEAVSKVLCFSGASVSPTHWPHGTVQGTENRFLILTTYAPAPQAGIKDFAGRCSGTWR